jgi:hypothetical protein
VPKSADKRPAHLTGEPFTDAYIRDVAIYKEYKRLPEPRPNEYPESYANRIETIKILAKD